MDFPFEDEINKKWASLKALWHFIKCERVERSFNSTLSFFSAPAYPHGHESLTTQIVDELVYLLFTPSLKKPLKLVI